MVLFDTSTEARGAEIVSQLPIKAQWKNESIPFVCAEICASPKCINVVCEGINEKGVSTLEHHSFSGHKAQVIALFTR